MKLFGKSEKRRSFFVSYDKTVFFISLTLMIFGLFIQLDIGSSRGSEHSLQFFAKQLIFFLVALPIMMITGRIQGLMDWLKRNIFTILIVSLIMLAATLIIGTTTKGGTRWIRFAGIGIQPSMIATSALIIYIAKVLDKRQYYADKGNALHFLGNFFPIVLMSCLVFALVYMENHLSTLIVLGGTILAMLFAVKVRMSTLITFVVIGAIGFIIILKSGESYRSDRMDIFSKYSLVYKALGKNTDRDSLNDYQVKESLTALSSGGILGTGLAKGRAKHYFLPDAKSDFIFAIIGEEFGFLGASLILLLFTYLFIKTWQIAISAESVYLKMVGLGLAVNVFFTAMVNIGVAISAIPPTGLTLPFISYGGSSLFMNAINIGLILNISAKHRAL